VLHSKINKSVSSITEYKNKWTDVHNKLTSDYENLLNIDNQKDALILKLKAEISGLKNQLNENIGALLSNDAKNQNYRDLTMQIHQLRQDLAFEKNIHKELERTHLSSCDEFNKKLEKSNEA
jgi:predicted RNase H-like nuclease (RuvC/YqgF family)